MATNPTDGTSVNLVERARNIITTPKTEWPVIEAEPSTIGGIYRSYVVILAAIPPVCMAIGLLLMGMGIIRFSAGFIIGQALLTYILSLVGVYVWAVIIDVLAPSFGGRQDRLSAFKLAAYSWTAAWLAGVFSIIPFLAILGIVGLYSFYLLYLGLPVLMKVPEDKSIVYLLAAVAAGLVIYLIVGMIASRIMWAAMPPVNTVTFSIPG